MENIYVADGNLKVDKSCLTFDLPTQICYGKGKQCEGCYAMRAELRYNHCLPSRMRNLKATKNKKFVFWINLRISKSSKKLFRIHSSGDFYSQEYLDKWIEIIKQNPNISFYGYSKKFEKVNFDVINALPNCNIIDSTPLGIKNFGDFEYITKLEKKLDFTICPCGIDDSAKCMKNCFLCLDAKRIAFLQH